MADNYVDLIANALEEVHPLLDDESFINTINNNYPDWNWDDFYNTIAWVGLTNETSAGEMYSQSEDYITNINLYLLNASANSTKEPKCE